MNYVQYDTTSDRSAFVGEVLDRFSNGFSFMMLEENEALRDEFDVAIGAMKALIDMDIFRPVCGFDGIILMGYVGKQMNTVKQDFVKISEEALDELNRLMQGEPGREVILPHTLVRMKYEDIIK